MIYAKYTIVLKTLLDDPESKTLIDKALSTYPLHTPKNDPNHMIIPTREEINKKILDYYKYREIGFETFGRWLDELEIAMNEIMPTYNQLFNSEDIINGLENIFGNLDVTETYERETEGSESSTGNSEVAHTGSSSSEGTDSSSGSSTSDTNTKNVHSETPQSQINIPASSIDNISYASDVTWNKSDTSSTTSTNGTTTSNVENESNESSTSSSSGTRSGSERYTLNRKGEQGVNTYAHDMLEFRQLFMNIIQKIIHDPRIEELFMNVF